MKRSASSAQAPVRRHYDLVAVFPFCETSFLLKREIPLDCDMNVEVKFSGEPARGHTMGTFEGRPRLG